MRDGLGPDLVFWSCLRQSYHWLGIASCFSWVGVHVSPFYLSSIWRSRAYVAGHPRLRDLGGNMVVAFYASLVVSIIVFLGFFYLSFLVICGEQAGLRGKGIEICGASWFDLSSWSHLVLGSFFQCMNESPCCS